mgnify:CR=1 FL=1
MLSQRVNPEVCANAGLKVIYTPLNGTGNKPVREVLHRAGIADVKVVPQQEHPDGNFPTCPFPNPEIRQAFELALKAAQKHNADILLATDPDCDRVGIAVNDGSENYELMSGNEVGAMLLHYLLSQKKANGTLPEHAVAAKSFVSTDLAEEIAKRFGCEFKNLLTGFKYIGELITKLEAQGRGEVWSEQKADPDAVYDEELHIDLSELVPLAACPHSPDNVKTVAEIGKLKIDQVCIGSCTNSSLLDMMKVAHILKGKTVNPDVSLAIAPGSKQVLNMMADMGILGTLIAAGARILESACGPCIGMGQSPNSGGISLRTFNRNFLGRSGTKDGQIYLVSPEMAAVSALTGYLTDPRTLGDMPEFKLPEHFKINDNMVVPPADEADMDSVEVLRGPNNQAFPTDFTA